MAKVIKELHYEGVVWHDKLIPLPTCSTSFSIFRRVINIYLVEA